MKCPTASLSLRRMDLRRNLALLALTGIASLAGPSAAAAATEVGDGCAGDTASGPFSLVPEQRASGGTLPLTAPRGGVVTGWKIDSAHAGPVVERLAVFRPTGKAGSFQVVAESDPLTVKDGFNLFPARVPVQAGDRFGLVGDSAESPLFCATENPDDRTWSYPGAVESGATPQFAAGAFVRVPLIGVVEPDADGDGYGDESQDGCPASGAFTGACPELVTLRVKPKVRRRSILLRVRPSAAASVEVYGQVGWNFKPKPKGERSKHGHRHSRRFAAKQGTRRLIIGLDGPTKQVTPGEVTRFTVKLPKPVLLRLSRLTRRDSIRAKLTLRATNAIGAWRNTRLRVKLRGWQKPGHGR